MLVVKEAVMGGDIGKSIHSSIQLKVDCPCNHEEGKMQVLDLKVRVQDINGSHRIVHEFYVKEVSSTAVIVKSALS